MGDSRDEAFYLLLPWPSRDPALQIGLRYIPIVCGLPMRDTTASIFHDGLQCVHTASLAWAGGTVRGRSPGGLRRPAWPVAVATPSLPLHAARVPWGHPECGITRRSAQT